jgi:hypothetical protein
VILAVLDQPHDRIRNRRIGGLMQQRKLCVDIAHDFTRWDGGEPSASLPPWTNFSNQLRADTC